MTVWVSYKNRSSHLYKFSTDDLECEEIKDLLKMVWKENEWLSKFPKSIRIKLGLKKLGIRVRGRGGPRGRYTHDTPLENATYYDIYIKEYKEYE